MGWSRSASRLIFSGLDIVHFAHGEIYMFGAFIGLALSRCAGHRLRAAASARPMILTGLVGVVIERLFYRRLTSGGGGYTVAGMGMIIVRLRHVDRAAERRLPDLGAEAVPVPGVLRHAGRDRLVVLPMSYVWIVVGGPRR